MICERSITLRNIIRHISYNRPLSILLEKAAQYVSTKNLFVACFPKSGSTYLTKLLSEITGFPRLSAVQFFGHNEQDIYEPALRFLALINSVTQQHVKGTENNVRLLCKYGIRPVILVRNIYDTVISYYDHLEKESRKVPAGFVHNEYSSMDRNGKLHFIIRIILPWYFSFFMSWREVSQNHLETIWFTYEELFRNQPAIIQQILDFYDLGELEDKIKPSITSVQNKNTRLNVGISGRGDSLTNVHKRSIVEIANVWGVDLDEMSSIGIYSGSIS